MINISQNLLKYSSGQIIVDQDKSATQNKINEWSNSNSNRLQSLTAISLWKSNHQMITNVL